MKEKVVSLKDNPRARLRLTAVFLSAANWQQYSIAAYNLSAKAQVCANVG